MNKRSIVLLALSLFAGCAVPPTPSPAAAPAAATFDLEEATVDDLQKKMATGTETSRSIVDKYLARIDAIDAKGPTLRSVLEINPDAKTIADQMDAERKAGKVRGPLHGIPVLIKDNIATGDKMMTTAGSLALEGWKSPKDAFIVKKLRDAGAVIIGKTNLSEWANIRARNSTSGWSGRGGQVKNPYALDRNPCGSSSGSGAAGAANLAAITIGTETDGSIVCPSAINALVGIKPTIGLVSRTGIIPISHTQDTAGPMTRTVADAAVLLAAISGADSEDSVTADAASKGAKDYTASLDANGLKGARIGVVREGVTGYSPVTDKVFEAAIADLKRLGAEVVDPANIESINKFGGSELDVLLWELKADIPKFFAWAGGNPPVKTLQDIIDFNNKNAAKEMPHFAQELFDEAQKKGPLTDKQYLDSLAKDTRLSRKEGIDAVMDKFKLDALIAPTTGPAWVIDHVNGDHFTGASSTVPAIAGYPDITVPAGNASGLPIGISFFGRAWSEPLLIKLAYAYEQGTKHRKPPTFRKSVESP